MKIGDQVKIVAKEDELKYICEYSRTIILNKPYGTIYHLYKDAAEVSCGLAGIHEFKLNQLKLKEK